MNYPTSPHNKKVTQGFTLLEMLAVIAIIGILTSIVYPNLSGSRERARDSERITEVSEIVLALELFYNACRTYPADPLDLGDNGGGACPSGVTLGSFLNDLPTGPTGDTYDYETNGTSFVVRATLKQNNAALSDDLDGANVIGVDCGQTPEVSGGYYYCKGN